MADADKTPPSDRETVALIPDADLLREAYEAGVIGRYLPTAMVARGEAVLWFRPDLTGQVMPNRMYFVSADGIKEIEE